MKFKSVKKSSEIVLEGVKVDLDIVDGSVKGVTFTDAKGNVVRMAERGYNLYVEVPAPPEIERKYRLHGSVLGLPVEQYFEDEYSANDEKRRLENGSRDDADLTVELVEVPVVA